MIPTTGSQLLPSTMSVSATPSQPDCGGPPPRSSHRSGSRRSVFPVKASEELPIAATVSAVRKSSRGPSALKCPLIRCQLANRAGSTRPSANARSPRRCLTGGPSVLGLHTWHCPGFLPCQSPPLAPRSWLCSHFTSAHRRDRRHSSWNCGYVKKDAVGRLEW